MTQWQDSHLLRHGSVGLIGGIILGQHHDRQIASCRKFAAAAQEAQSRLLGTEIAREQHRVRLVGIEMGDGIGGIDGLNDNEALGLKARGEHPAQ